VEDDPAQSDFLERVLRQARIANPIHAIADGSDAEAYLTGSPPYADRVDHPLPVLVLLDLGLPGVGGLELLETIRGTFGPGEMAVVVVSGSQEGEDIDRAFEIGGNSYLVKPVAFSALIDTLENLALPRAILPPSAIEPS